MRLALLQMRVALLQHGCAANPDFRAPCQAADPSVDGCPCAPTSPAPAADGGEACWYLCQPPSRAQIQAQLKLAATLRQMADQAGKNNIELEGIDIAGDLEDLKKNIAKFKRGKYGGGLSDIEINDLDWIDQNSRKVKAVTIFIYETSV